MVDMRGWSFPIGRFLGVDVRIHTFFLLLLGLSISYASMTGATGARGFALWLLLLLAIFIREVARAIAAAWFGLEVRNRTFTDRPGRLIGVSFRSRWRMCRRSQQGGLT